MSGRFDSWLKKLTNPTDDKYDRVTRFYTYSWDGDERCAPAGWQQNCFDSGMIDIANGATRPAYSVLDKYTP
jgi:hypothetical protein